MNTVKNKNVEFEWARRAQVFWINLVFFSEEHHENRSFRSILFYLGLFFFLPFGFLFFLFFSLSDAKCPCPYSIKALRSSKWGTDDVNKNVKLKSLISLTKRSQMIFFNDQSLVLRLGGVEQFDSTSPVTEKLCPVTSLKPISSQRVKKN